MCLLLFRFLIIKDSMLSLMMVLVVQFPLPEDITNVDLISHLNVLNIECLILIDINGMVQGLVHVVGL